MCNMETLQQEDKEDKPVLPNELMSLIAYHSPDTKTLLKLLTLHRAFHISPTQKEEFMCRASIPFVEHITEHYWPFKKYVIRGYKLPNGKIHGPWKKIHKKEHTYNGAEDFYLRFRTQREKILMALCYYSNGKRHGKCMFWYDNSQPRSEENYVNGILDGPYKSWAWTDLGEKARLLREGNFSRGDKIGIWKRYGYNEELIKQECYVRGKKEGLCTVWYEKQVIKKQGPYKENLKHGLWTLWDKHGNVVWKRNYSKGHLIAKE
jgi:antitoxin component YwqK of YwqJK toxin-antitoxin module